MKSNVGTRSCPSQAAGDACPICLEKVFAGIDAVFAPCGHAVHEKCASAIASTGTLREAALYHCPVCRLRCPHDQLTSAHRGDPVPGSKGALKHTRQYKYTLAARAYARVCAIKRKEPSTRAETTANILAHRKKWRAIELMSCDPANAHVISKLFSGIKKK